MFKPQTFQFDNTIHWPGSGPTNEISAYHIEEVQSDGDGYIFKHASGYAVKVPKSSVTSFGVFDSDDIPNLPSKDDKDENKPTNPPGTRTPLPGPVEVPQVPLAPNAGSVEIIPPRDAAADETKPSVPEDVDHGDTSTEPKSDTVSEGSDVSAPSEDKAPDATETVPSAIDAPTDTKVDDATETKPDADTGAIEPSPVDKPADDAASQSDVTPVDLGPDFHEPSTDTDAAKTDGDVTAPMLDGGSVVDEPSTDQTIDKAADDDSDATDDQSELSDVLGDSNMKLSKKAKKSKK